MPLESKFGAGGALYPTKNGHDPNSSLSIVGEFIIRSAGARAQIPKEASFGDRIGTRVIFHNAEPANPMGIPFAIPEGATHVQYVGYKNPLMVGMAYFYGKDGYKCLGVESRL